MPDYYLSPLLYCGTREDLFFTAQSNTLRKIKQNADFRITLAQAKPLPLVGRYLARMRIPVYLGHPTKKTAQCGKVVAVDYDPETNLVLNVIFKLHRKFPELPFISPTFKTQAVHRNLWEPVRLEYIGLTGSPKLVEEPYRRINYSEEGE